MNRRVRVLFVAIAVAIAGCQAQPTQTTRLTEAPPTSSPSHSAVPMVEPSPTILPSGVIGAFTTTIAAPDGSFPVDITVEDRTGLVSGIEGALPGTPDERLVEAAPPQQGLRYTWLMLGCSRKVVITFEPAELFGTNKDSFRISAVHEGQGGDCVAVELGRSVLLKLSRPIRATSVKVLPGAAASFRLMFDHFAEKYPTEFEMLDTTGLVAGLAHPTKLGDHSGLTDAMAPDVGLVYWPTPSTCSYRVAMVFEAAEDGSYRLRVWFDTDWRGFDCGGGSGGRWVLIELGEPVPASTVQVVVEHAT